MRPTSRWIRSLAYERVTQCLEVRFKWNSVQQYGPVPSDRHRGQHTTSLDLFTREFDHRRYGIRQRRTTTIRQQLQIGPGAWIKFPKPPLRVGGERERNRTVDVYFRSC